MFESKVLPDKETEGAKYKDYFDFKEPVYKIPSHRILAVLRGFLEGYLKMSIAPAEEQALHEIEQFYITNCVNSSTEQIKRAIREAYRRLLQPSLETEFRTALKQKADEDAINVFSENLRQLLLGSPLGNKKLIAIDPGYRTGCKVVCLDDKGELLTTDVIFPHENNRRAAARSLIESMVSQYGIEAFAIGDGTAGRETEQFIKSPQPRAARFYGERRWCVGLFGIGNGKRRISRSGCYRARRRKHWQEIDGSAGRTGKDRPEEHRRRAISA